MSPRSGARTFLSAARLERSTILIVPKATSRSDVAADRNVRAPGQQGLHTPNPLLRTHGSGSPEVKLSEMGSVVGQGSQKLLLFSSFLAAIAFTRSICESQNIRCPRP